MADIEIKAGDVPAVTSEDKKEDFTKILGCSCVHPGQDRLHGMGQRVHNRTNQHVKKEHRKWRCTVCKQEK